MITVHHLKHSRSQRVLWPKLMGFLARIHAHPAYQKALERGGPFELLS